jgi:Carboxypeptidase regulatory-like domain
MKVRIWYVAVCLLLVATRMLWVVQAKAQATTASISGTITDPSGAVLSGATVTVVNASTGISSVQKTDSKGYFLFPDLHIGGPYKVSVDKDGFQRFISAGIMLDLSSAREVDAQLRVGASSETVNINAAAVQVETSDMQLKNVVGAAEIEDLPTLGRDAVQLQKTTSGVVDSSDRMGTFSTNGSQTQENAYLLGGFTPKVPLYPYFWGAGGTFEVAVF